MDMQPACDTGEPCVGEYDPSLACNGTTLLSDVHDEKQMRIIEVDMSGEIVWQYIIPQALVRGAPVGLDADLLDNGNILFTLSGSGIYEIDRMGTIVWSHIDPQVSHDADRLPNGDTLYVFGNGDKQDDLQVKQVDSSGSLIWSWMAQDNFNTAPYVSIDRQGWTHINSVTRIRNGNTLVSLRNFGLTVELDAQGGLVWEIDWTDLYETDDPRGLDPHEPELHPDGHLLVCLQWEAPYQVVEIDRATGQAIWEYHRDAFRTCRDADRLPNGNTLIVGVLEDRDAAVVFEVTPEKEIAWELTLHDMPVGHHPGWFFKAQRICP